MFFGALNREQDWSPFMPTINAVAAMAGERLKFQVVHDQSFFDALETPHKTFTPTCDYETYLRILGGSDISFMPLADTPFNRAKSDLKFIEAAACRVAALASSVVYSQQHRGRTDRPAVPRPGGVPCPAAAAAGDAGNGPRNGRRGTPYRDRRSHAGVSGGASDRLVPVALGSARQP